MTGQEVVWLARTKTYEEINEKIKSGKVTVVTAEEIIPMVKEERPGGGLWKRWMW